MHVSGVNPLIGFLCTLPLLGQPLLLNKRINYWQGRRNLYIFVLLRMEESRHLLQQLLIYILTNGSSIYRGAGAWAAASR